MRGTIGAVGRS